MKTNELDSYISTLYPMWLKYTKKLCAQKGTKEEADDVLQYVMEIVLKKDGAILERLCNMGIDDLNHYVVFIIRRNILPPSTPFQRHHHKNEKYIDRSVDLWTLNTLDESEDEVQRKDAIEEIKYILEQLDIPDKHRKIFEFRYLEGKIAEDWPGTETPSYLSKICSEIRKMLQEECHRRHVL